MKAAINPIFLSRFLCLRMKVWIWGWCAVLSLLTGCVPTHVSTAPSRLPPSEPKPLVFPSFVAGVASGDESPASLAARYLKDPSKAWLVQEFDETRAFHPGDPFVVPLEDYQRGGLTLRGYQTVPVLTYHKFSETLSDQMTVKASAFEAQMRFMKDNGFHVIPLDDLFDFMAFKRQIPQKAVVITIDDGWRSVYDIAFPILRKYGYPATLFVYTDLITGNQRTLDWRHLREMAGGGVDLQCHSKTHRSFAGMGPSESFRDYFEALKKELVESAAVIREKTGADVKYVAYPYGDTNPLVESLLMKLGFRGGLTVERKCNPFFVNPFRVGRSMIYGVFDLPRFARELGVFEEETLD
jgi:peptidoglycan/xylan/chitin deacetylase (PgdA/CDA1 family)